MNTDASDLMNAGFKWAMTTIAEAAPEERMNAIAEMREFNGFAGGFSESFSDGVKRACVTATQLIQSFRGIHNSKGEQ